MNTVPRWFYVVASVALLWNLLGTAAVIMNFMLTSQDIAALPLEQQQMYAKTPIWSSYASLLAVVSGSLACVMMLIKKKVAYWLTITSLLSLVVQNIGIFVVVDAIAVLGISVLVMQGVVALISAGLILLARYAIERKWLH